MRMFADLETLLSTGGRSAAIREAQEDHTEPGSSFSSSSSSSLSATSEQTASSKKLGFALQQTGLRRPRLKLPWKDAGL